MTTTRILAISVLVLVMSLPVDIANADFTFGEPTLFDEPVNSTGIEYFGCISVDGLEVYIDKPVSGGITSLNWDIYVSTRETINDPWSAPVSIGPTFTRGYVGGYESMSSDGLELFFASRRPGGYGEQDIWVTTRDSKGGDWGTPVNLGPPVNTSSSDLTPWITQDGLELYFSSDRPGGYGVVDIWVARRTTTKDEWGEPVNLGPVVNSTAGDYFPCLSPDGLELFFSDYDNPAYRFRPGGHGQSDMWMSRRKSTADPWETPVNLGPGMNTSSFDSQPRVSPDGSVLYFNSSRPGKLGGFSDIWQAPIIPIVDLNNDGIVDSLDMCVMVDHWGENYSLCDIGPTPLGDGIVDVDDLTILAEQLFTYPGAVSYWKLDETEGNTAHDSIGDNKGTVNGEPAWQPDGGIVAGALQFDGIDDYVSTEFVLNPTDGEFSIFTWIKDGAPGQVVLSQTDGANWLVTDIDGNMMTELRGPGRGAGELLSQTIITDGNWHRIGLVWDGSQRTLYVDDVAVAEDTQGNLESSDNGLYIGTSKAMDSGTFWSGLIDDVRVYNRVVSP